MTTRTTDKCALVDAGRTLYKETLKGRSIQKLRPFLSYFRSLKGLKNKSRFCRLVGRNYFLDSRNCGVTTRVIWQLKWDRRQRIKRISWEDFFISLQILLDIRLEIDINKKFSALNPSLVVLVTGKILHYQFSFKFYFILLPSLKSCFLPLLSYSCLQQPSIKLQI